MFCPKCGTPSDGGRFCGNCGYNFVAAQNKVPQSVPVGATVQGAYGGATAATAARAKSKKPLIIAIAAVVVIIAAVCVYFVACSAKPTYALTRQITYHSDGDIECELAYARNAEGVPVSTSMTANAQTGTTAQRDIGDGVTVSEEMSGTYKTDGSGDVIFIERRRSGNELFEITEISYYRPGIVKKTVSTYYDSLGKIASTRVREYNEDGWLVSLDVDYNDSSSSYTSKVNYDFAADGRSAIATVTSNYVDGSLANPVVVYRMELNEAGMPTKIYQQKDGKEWLSEENFYEKVEHPAPYVAAMSRLKLYF